MKKDVYELTNPQKSIWSIEQFYKGTSVNSICGTVIFDEIVDFDKLKSSIKHVGLNNKNFGLNFVVENNIPKQFFTDIDFEIETVELKTRDDLDSFRDEILSKPIDVQGKQLFNFYIFKFSNNYGGFVLNIHHLISDGWSLGLISTGIINNYYNLLHNLPLINYEYSYQDYIISDKNYMQSNKFEKDKLYWDSIFETIPEIAMLPGSSNNKLKLQSSAANRKTYQIDKDLISSINSFCRKYKVSIFNFFMAIYGLYVGKVCGLDRFVIGTPILNRSTFKDKQTCGMYISTVPFVINLQGEKTFDKFVQDISVNSLNMLRHQKYPYQNILETIRKDNKNIPNLYNILLSYQITKALSNDLDFNCFTDWRFNKNCADPLNIHLFDLDGTGELNLAYDYQTSIYTAYDIDCTHQRILNMIRQILDLPEMSLDDVEIITPQEKNKILNKFNETDFSYDDSLNIIDLFKKQVKLNPDKIAIISNNMALSYKELDKKSNILANYLINKHNIKPNDIVGIMLNRCPEMIIGLLAILKCGATYLPIDPEYPNERIFYMLENSEAKTVLVNHYTEESIPVKYTKIDIDFKHNLFEKNSSLTYAPSVNIDSSTLAYLIYTSGSTGKPKGVMITHKNLHNFVNGMKKLIDFNSKKVMVSLTTICFDIFGLELWCTLSSGMTFVLANEKEQNSTKDLNDLCLKNNVNMIQTTPSRYMTLFSDKENLQFLENITDIMVGGEALSKNLLTYLKEISHANIYNMYGPTETTIWSTVKDLTNSDFITIGKPIVNTQCYVLDKNQKLLPSYIPGELYIGGDGVTNGYLKRKKLTDEKFIKSPFNNNTRIYNTNDLAYFTKDGEIVHLGRTDFQVKIRGYRIELGEIESKIIQFPNINNAVVVASPDNKFLVCYYVSDCEIKNSKLISHLLKYLPNYMIPAYFKRLDTIPLTPNGKVNKKALPPIDSDNNIELPKTETEKMIANALSNILHTDKIDINAPFLSLGLDSLGLIQLQTALLAYNFNLTTQSFYRYPSIKRLAKRIDSKPAYYTEFDFQIPSQFKHTDNELDNLNFNTKSVLGNVLLTGANGFIGVHVLNELLETTNSKIYCFVRGENIEHSIKRLDDNFVFYFGKSIRPYINKRVFVYNGQIVCNNFKLSDSQLEEISSNITTIIHTAAIVKHYGDFEQFKIANIDGTRRMVEFAYNNNKRLIHISSISVSGNYLVKQDNKGTEFSENSLYIGQHYTTNVYVNSKFDAEKIVYEYMEKGLTAEVLRIGILAGRYSDGFFQKNISENAFYGRIKSLVELKDISTSMLNQNVEFTPVDLCAKAIVLLAKNKIAENKVYHLYNHHLASIKNTVKILNDFGTNISVINDKDFEKYLLSLSSDTKNKDIFKGIINDISFDDSNLSLNYSFTVNISSKYTQDLLKKLGFEWPKTDDIYLRKLIEYMKKVKFI